MSIAVPIPKGVAASKPPYGRPCNRCGLCCMATLCPLAEHVFKPRPGPCPALTRVGSGYECGLVIEPALYAPALAAANGADAMRAAARKLIGSGDGCDARINGEPDDPAYRAALAENDRRTAPENVRAKATWGALASFAFRGWPS